MNAGVVHDDDRVRSGERVHHIQKSIDKTVKLLGSVWMVFCRKVQDPIEGKSGKNGIASGLLAKEGGAAE